MTEIPAGGRSGGNPPKQAELHLGGNVLDQCGAILAGDFLPLLGKSHDRVGRSGDLIPRRAGKAPGQDRFEFLPIDMSASL